MSQSTSALKGCTSLTTLCILLTVFSSLSIIVTVRGNEVGGEHSLMYMNRMGRSISNLQHQAETKSSSPQGILVNRISNKEKQKVYVDDNEGVERDDNSDGRVKRASQSGYIRFGKRFTPLIDTHGGAIESNPQNDLENGLDSLYYEDTSDPEEDIFLRHQRAPDSSYVRFGKRIAPAGLSYSGCVAYTLSRARNRSDLLRMLVENGCVKDKRNQVSGPSFYSKKDGYIRFGK